ncbi:MAG: sugar porter family MFS transporter [Simkania sp.]|nr:sugar porter family MFS transporter [Simkania sp.]
MPIYAVGAVIVAALGGFLFGYNTAIIAGALLFIKEQFHLDPQMQGWTVSIILLGALIAAMITGSLADRFGRRRTILLSALLFILGAILVARAPDNAMFMWGRFITGLGVGLVSVVAPMYLSEISSAKHRGSIVAIYQLAITIGILVAYGSNYAFASSENGWRMMMVWGAAPAVLQLLLSSYLPESPRWLLGMGKETKAHEVVKKLHLRELLEEKISTEKRSRWAALFATPSIRWAFFVGIILAIFQQITGINAVIYYAPDIFQLVGFPSNESAILATVGIGGINVIATVFAVWLLDKVGRRMLLLVGLCGMTIALACISLAFYIKSPGINTISMVALMGYVAFFAIGLGPVTWVILSEIYPLSVRGKAMSVATLVNWLFNYLLALTFIDIVNWFGTGMTFLGFAVLCVICFFFVLKIPETKGKKLGEIQKLFSKT